MDVINFGHGAFISVGAFVGVSVRMMLGGMTGVPSLWLNLLAVLLAIIAAAIATGALGLAFEMYDDFGRYRTEERLEEIRSLIGAWLEEQGVSLP